MAFNGFVLAGTHSGAGKTTLTAGILGALKARGKVVQAFKTGPDYIDPAFHAFITKRSAYNLDTYMLSEDSIRHLYAKHVAKSDVAVVEGVMGLYDGFGGTEDIGSTAYLAKLLNLPVILVIDGSGLSRTAGAIVKGFQTFDPQVQFAGVIVNKVSGQAHYELIKEVVESTTGIPCLGFVPKNQNVRLTSRHLGLVPAGEVEDLESKLKEVIQMIENSICLDELLRVTTLSKPTPRPHFVETLYGQYEGLRVGVAEDRSFSFYYADNLELLKALGAELVSFSPMSDKALPEVDMLYIGGGFPEVFAKELEANSAMRMAIKAFAESNRPIYAECGGLMYLCEALTDLEGTSYPMCGLIAANAVMTGKLKHFGYNEIDVLPTLSEKGIQLKGHEFHRSELKFRTDGDRGSAGYQLRKRRKGEVQSEWTCGYLHHNAFGAYAHIHFYTEPAWVCHWLELAKNQKELRHESI